MRCIVEKMSALRGLRNLKRFEAAATAALVPAGLIDKYGDIPGVIRFIFVTTPAMTRLNGMHLHHQGATDVITYSYFDDALFSAGIPGEEPVLSEIYICPDIARMYALQFKQPPSRELFLYAVHGLLHCAGEDDLTDAARLSMRQAEARVMSEIEASFSLLEFMQS